MLGLYIDVCLVCALVGCLHLQSSKQVREEKCMPALVCDLDGLVAWFVHLMFGLVCTLDGCLALYLQSSEQVREEKSVPALVCGLDGMVAWFVHLMFALFVHFMVVWFVCLTFFDWCFILLILFL